MLWTIFSDVLSLWYEWFRYDVYALKMLICSEKHPVSRANHGHIKKVVTDRGPTIVTLSAAQFSANFDI